MDEVERIAKELAEALSHIIGASNEAPKFGPFDCIDNHGEYYQSADFAAGLAKGRKALAAFNAHLTKQARSRALDELA